MVSLKISKSLKKSKTDPANLSLSSLEPITEGNRRNQCKFLLSILSRLLNLYKNIKTDQAILSLSSLEPIIEGNRRNQ